MNYYQQMIAKFTAANPRYVEAWMRCNVGGTLDHLSGQEFVGEATLAAECVSESTDYANEQLAQSYGL